MTSNTDVDLTSQWKCWYNVKIQRRSNVALRRLNNLLSTSFVVVLTLIQRCLDVAMRRWNNVVFRCRTNISIAIVSRRYSDVRIQRCNDVDTTSLCLLRHGFCFSDEWFIAFLFLVCVARIQSARGVSHHLIMWLMPLGTQMYLP